MEPIFFTSIAVMLFIVNVALYFRVKDLEFICENMVENQQVNNEKAYINCQLLEELRELNLKLSADINQQLKELSSNSKSTSNNWENLKGAFTRPGQKLDGSN